MRDGSSSRGHVGTTARLPTVVVATLVGVTAAGLFALAARRRTRAARRGTLRPSRLTDVELRALAQSREPAAVATDVALADRYDRYAG